MDGCHESHGFLAAEIHRDAHSRHQTGLQRRRHGIGETVFKRKGKDYADVFHDYIIICYLCKGNDLIIQLTINN